MLDALRSLMAPPALVVLGGVVGAVAAFGRLFRRPGSNHTSAEGEQVTMLARVVGMTRADPFDAFLRSLDRDRDDEG
jgi:hypothetical protein